MSKRNQKPDTTVATNRRAYHDYTIEDTLVAGLVLTGPEVKSIRQKEVSMGEAFVKIVNGEVLLYGLYIKPYEQAGAFAEQDPHRIRKLLLNRKEIKKLSDKIKLQGYSLIPIKLFLGGPWVKALLGWGKGKKNYDKRADLAAKDQKRDIQRAMKRDAQ